MGVCQYLSRFSLLLGCRHIGHHGERLSYGLEIPGAVSKMYMDTGNASPSSRPEGYAAPPRQAPAALVVVPYNEEVGR